MPTCRQDRIGEFFADAILNSERQTKFDYSAFLARHGEPGR